MYYYVATLTLSLNDVYNFAINTSMLLLVTSKTEEIMIEGESTTVGYKGY